MKIITFLILFFTISGCLANGPEPLTVMAPSGIIIRENPSIESKILKGLPFGYIVYSNAPKYTYSMNEHYNSDTINGVIGYWIDVEYQEINGFAFSPYLYRFYNNTVIDTNITEQTVKFTSEGLFHGECDYHPKLLWYGIYEDSSGLWLKEVNVDIRLSKEEPIFFSEFEDMNYGCNFDGQIYLETDTNSKSLFLIGVGKKWSEGEINYTVLNNELGYYKEVGFIYPEQKRKFEFNGYNYILRAFDSVSVDHNYKLKKLYQLEFIETHYDNKNEIVKNKINISEGLKLYGTGKLHSEYLTPQLHFVGDINMDGLLDLIIFQFGMVNHGGSSLSYNLFLSNIYPPEKLTFKVDALSIQRCR